MNRIISCCHLNFLLTILLVLATTIASAQRNIVVMKGKVTDASTNTPLPAEITYKTLPYGSITGKKSFNNGGTYQFKLPKTDTFEITVNAQSYQPIVVNIVPDKDAKNGVISKDFSLLHRPQPGEILNLQNKIYFGRGSYSLNEQSKKAAEEILNILERNPTMRIRLEGHTDYRGSEDLLMRLSKNRIMSIKNYLVQRGIDGDRIETKAFGGSQPLVRGNSQEARQKNRRVEIRILQR